jgi:hypothetical protein
MDRHSARRASSFRFTQLRPTQAPPLSDEAVRLLAERLTSQGPAIQRGKVPAGYTYLGQFVAHDLSFDVTHAGLATALTTEDMRQARSPSLDLDSLYGKGPQDPRSAPLYRAGGPFLATGRTDPDAHLGPLEDADLPRRVDLPRRDAARKPGYKAVIGDPRNDDNLAVAQTHLAFIRFHNRVVEHETDPDAPVGERLAVAREIVTRHYQWVVWKDLLPRICDPHVLDAVWRDGRTAIDPGAGPGTPGEMPLEFALGVFRVGHSMIRAEYDWNRFVSPSLGELFVHSGRGGDLAGRTRLRSSMVADFRRLYDFRDADRSDLVADVRILARRIDTRIAQELAWLPLGTFDATAPPSDDLERNLAFRNLMRARASGLASGQEMAAFLSGRGVPVGPLSDQQLLYEPNEYPTHLELGLGKPGLAHTPLWIHTLREAELGDFRLAGVGAWLLAETFHLALAGSRISILDPPGWVPHLSGAGQRFKMPHLLLYAADGDAAGLAPPDS